MRAFRKHFNPEFNPTFVAVGPCKHCGKPADRFGGHQFMVGFRFCVRKMMAARRAA
jgi:hypothetical protein